MLERPVLKVRLTDPCPCGSGRKYKRCCWARERREFAEALADIREAPSTIGGFLGQRLWPLVEKAHEALLEEAAGWVGIETMDRMAEKYGELLENIGLEASLIDVKADGSKTAVELFLSDPASKALRPSTREYLKALSRSVYSLYEIEEVRPGEGLTVKDLLRRRRLTVLDRSSSQTLKRWQIAFARVVQMEKVCLFSNAVLTFDRRFLEWLLEELPNIKRLDRGKSLSWTRFLKREWTLPPALWLSFINNPSIPRSLTNTDGDPLVQIDLAVEIAPGKGAELRRRLNAAAEIRPDGESRWVLMGPGSGAFEEGVLLASFELAGSTLRVSVNSELREARVRELLDRLAGDCLGEVSRTAVEVTPELVERWQEEGPAPDPEAAIPPEVEEQLVHEVLDRHYRSWVDQPVPALDDMTPRQAAADRSMRTRLISLLKEFEVRQAGSEAAMATYDTSWLWAELGLRRP